MRLRRLDLIRYGKFENRSLDFGDRDDESDVAVVYGANEAGKSTAFAAWLDLLYGLPLQHPHAFRFERKEMMVGATLETEDGVLELRRTGARNGSLTDGNGREVDERRLAVLLHGLDRDAYRSRFSLDETVLREGGEEISRAQGDLGRLLHAGVSGLSGISDTLDVIEKEVDGFHKKGGRATTVAETKRELEDLRARIAEARVDPRRFDALRRSLETSERELEEKRTAHSEAQAQLFLRQAADRQRVLGTQMENLRRSLQGFPNGPGLTSDAINAAAAAIVRKQDAIERRAEARQLATDAREAIAALMPDPDGLEVAAILKVLEEARFDDGELLLPRVQTAAADVDRRRKEQDALAQRAALLAERVAGQGSKAAAIRLPRETLLNLRTRAQSLRDAEMRGSDIAETRKQAEAALGPAIPMPAGLEALGDALGVLDKVEANPAALARDAAERRLAADRAAAGLPSDWHDLAEAGLPAEAEAIELHERNAALARQAEEIRKRLTEATEACADIAAEHEALLTSCELATDERIVETRSVRDAAWTRHRAALDETTADAFETEMRKDDEARARHSESTEQRLRLQTIAVELGRRSDVAQRRRKDHEIAAAQLDLTRVETAAMAARLGLAEVAPTSAFRERRAALAGALDAALLAKAAQSAATAASTTRRAALSRLVFAVAEAGGAEIDVDDDRLVPEARRLKIKLDEQAEELRAQTRAAGSLEKMSRDLEARSAEAEARRQEYETASSGLWCADWSAAALLAAMADLEALAEIYDKVEDLSRRIDLMEAALARFGEDAGALARLLKLDPAARATDVLAAARHRGDAAEKSAQRLEALDRKLEEAEQTERGCDATISRSDEVIAEALADQDGIDLAQPASALEALQRRDELRRELAEDEIRHDREAGSHDPDALLLEEENSDPARTSRLQSALDEAETERDTALELRSEAKAELQQAMNAAGGAELDQQRATLLESLREEARLMAARLLGLSAARGALRRFRQESRGDMLEATEAAFVHMTHGEWSGLDTQPVGKTERLVGIRDGAVVPTHAMSTGTRGQLYLALRVAGYANFIDGFAPLPFITDDIHETFDDNRARAALELSKDMGSRGQAILFTHHRHLVELAKITIPSISVIDL